MDRARVRTSTVIGFGYLAGLACYARLPGPFLATAHVSPLSRPLIALLLPTTAAVIDELLHRLWIRDAVRGSDAAVDAAFEAIVFRIIVMVIAIHLLVLAGLSGVAILRPWAGRIVLVIVGAALIAIGNLLPRTRPNVAFGIRTSRTLSDRRLWMVTHRAAGQGAVALGAVVMVAGAVLPGPAMPLAVGAAGLVAATAVLISYRRAAHA